MELAPVDASRSMHRTSRVDQPKFTPIEARATSDSGVCSCSRRISSFLERNRVLAVGSLHKPSRRHAFGLRSREDETALAAFCTEPSRLSAARARE
jgi:hypothetical protein